MLRRSEGIEELRQQKMAKLHKFLNLNMIHIRKGFKYDFLTDKLRKDTSISDTSNISSWGYDQFCENLIVQCEDGLVLDCGAGRRPVYYSNVVNYEIVDYDTTDVIGVGERLPFKDSCFDGVISVAVLEHVRDPFASASEIVRVLRPGGRLVCAVPFLQPEHGYPHHYYNMAPQGARALFERQLTIDGHKVYGSGLPVWALRWIVQSWANGLDGVKRDAFLSMPLSKVIEQAPDHEIIAQDWVTGLSEKKKFELACGTVVFAHKPEAQSDAYPVNETPIGASSPWRYNAFSCLRRIWVPRVRR
jgi:SAM-dependent methyltransferase